MKSEYGLQSAALVFAIPLTSRVVARLLDFSQGFLSLDWSTGHFLSG